MTLAPPASEGADSGTPDEQVAVPTLEDVPEPKLPEGLSDTTIKLFQKLQATLVKHRRAEPDHPAHTTQSQHRAAVPVTMLSHMIVVPDGNGGFQLQCVDSPQELDKALAPGSPTPVLPVE